MYANANYGRHVLLNPQSVPWQAGPSVRQRGGVFGPQGYGGGIFDGMSGIGTVVGATSSNGDGAKYPWMEYSPATQSLQFATNVELDMRDMPEIGTDGVLGSETCGAQQYLYEEAGLAEHKPPASCQAFQYPAQPSAPAPGPGPAPAAPAPEVPSRVAGMGTVGFVLIAGGIAAAGVYLATRKGRR